MTHHIVRAPTCASCPSNLYFAERLPKRQQGVMMYPGERFCVGGKRARKFSHSDPKTKVPDWCPRRKNPCELRVYEFKDSGAWYLHERICHDLKKDIDPRGRACSLAYEGYTKLTPKEFWEQRENDTESLGVKIHYQNIVEIDDGLAPVCFFKADNGYRVLTLFDTAAARANPPRKRSEAGEA